MTVKIELRDDREVPTEEFVALYKLLGFRNQTEAAEALGLQQGYVSRLLNGKQQVQPRTSLLKLLQALHREVKRYRNSAD